MPKEPEYNVYVIELDRAVLDIKKFVEKKPDLEPEKACFYVGSTCHSPDERFRQHKDGYKANRYVRKHGLWLRRRIYRRYNPIPTRDAALTAETELAERLRRKGHAVWQN